ncbi:MAG: thermonuclease family protein [Rhodothermales bacterium]
MRAPAHRLFPILSASLPFVAVLVASALLAGCRDADLAPARSPRTVPLAAPHAERYPAVVWRVIDGDTVELVLDDGDPIEEGKFVKVRVRGIDTPEHHASSKLDRDAERSAIDRRTIRTLGTAATAHAESLLPLGAAVTIEGSDRDRYGRLVAFLSAEDAAGQPFDFGGRMIGDGYAHAYDGAGRYPHPRMSYYRALQRQAREHGLGLWAADPDATARLSP